jgi:rubrerythrin
MAKSLKGIEAKDNTPVRILSSYSTDYIKRYFGVDMPMTIDIELVDVFPIKSSIPYHIKLSWRCEKCNTQVNDDEIKVCPECGTARTR